MDMNYRVSRELINGQCDVFFYQDDLASAKRFMTRMKNEKKIRTIWAELQGTDFDKDESYKPIYGFERETIEVLGTKVATGRIIEY